MAQIIPAILATTEEEYKDKLQKIESCPELAEGWVQIDLMDNKFVQNRSIGPDIIAKYLTELKLEAHLMVEYPESWIDELIKIPVARIIFPVEDISGINERIIHIKNHEIEVGLSLNPETSVKAILPFLDKVDVALILGVHPGFQAQEFIPKTIEKIKEILRLRSGRNFKITVDGGIRSENAKLIVDAGADLLVVGSYLFEGVTDENLEKIRKAI